MILHQRFRNGDMVETLTVRKDKNTGELYSLLIDIQETFPEARRFRVKGAVINFLLGENEQRYDPKRIAYYPDDIIDIVAASPTQASAILPVSEPRAQLLTDDRMIVTLSSLSIQPALPVRCDAHIPRPLTSSPCPCTTPSSPTIALQETAFITRPMAVLTSIASEISQIQTKLDRSTNDRSAHHMQLMQQLFHMVQRQNDTLKQLAEAKEREEKMLMELAAAKERDEELRRMQQQTIDRLIVAQQKIEAILVQNYELHEYPIPRLFVILPDSYERWDPRNFVKERFRLFFLCECSDLCNVDITTSASSDQLTIATAEPLAPIPVKSSIHLAKHEGYELSRPTEFFDQYGPYVLSMLKILRHCLTVAAVIAPAVAMAESGVKDIMDGVKSISESTMGAVDMSIGFLEKTLDEETVRGVGTQSSTSTKEERMFEDLAALEGADLRRLDSFLRNKDADKILGNLYRITTNQGHVKWVCFDHYKETYRHTALTSFSQSVEAAGGVYDPHFRKISISLTSSTTAKDFFRRLVNQAPAVDVLNVSLDWNFGSADLVMVVDMLRRTNVRIFNLDLKDVAANATIASLRPGKGRYHSLLGLLSNTKLRGLCFTNLLLLSARTSDLPSSHRPSLLQSFRFLQEITAEENARLTNILHHCPGLVDVRLGSTQCWNKMDSSLQHGLCSLKELQSLHLYNVDQQDCGVEEDNHFSFSDTMRDLYFSGSSTVYLQTLIHQKWTSLGVLILYNRFSVKLNVDLTSPSEQVSTPRLLHEDDVSSRLLIRPLSSNLTHLDLSAGMSAESINRLASILPELNLVHFGTGCFAKNLLKHVNIGSLKSLSVLLEHRDDPQALIDYLLPRKDVCQIDSLMLRSDAGTLIQLNGLLNHFPLKRLFLSFINVIRLETLLASLNVSRLQLLSICNWWYDWTTESIVARKEELLADLTVELGYHTSWGHKEVYQVNNRGVNGTKDRLARDRVVLRESDFGEQQFRFSALVVPPSLYI